MLFTNPGGGGKGGKLWLGVIKFGGGPGGSGGGSLMSDGGGPGTGGDNSGNGRVDVDARIYCKETTYWAR